MSKKIELSANAEEVAMARYFNNGENWETATVRVADAIASVEKDKKLYAEKFHEMIYNMDFIPAGRILRNAGKQKGSLLNCYALPIGDSIEEIGRFLSDCLVLWSEGGGVGCNFSPLRPCGDPISGKGGSSSGMVSFIEMSDAVAKPIESGGQRRAAGLACCDVSHPEIVNFINAKLVDKKISHFNISVLVNEQFMKTVESNGEWTFKFKQKEYGHVKAKDLWNMIIKNMVTVAEPGLLNSTNLFKNNSYYYDPVVTTNPCGEAVLENYGSCDLGSLVLPNFITGNINTNWKKLEGTIKLAVRFLDDVIDVNRYSLKEIDIKAHNSRRIGVGIMGLAEYLFAKEIRYGSKDSILEIEKLMRFIRDVVYETLIELSVEKGSFPKFDPVAYGNASFVRKLPAQLRIDIKNKGVRCVTGLSIAPTGTISLLPEVSSGIEPLPYKSYRRKDRVGERIYIHPKYKELLINKQPIPDWFVDASELTPKEHLEVQAIVQRYVDGAVSKTINLPAKTTPQQLDILLQEFLRDLKGVTVYTEGSREGQIYNKLSKEETIEVLKKEKSEDFMSAEDIECKGLCDIKNPATL
jgi:ribonucleoside-diphosphate reductase alpha chain